MRVLPLLALGLLAIALLSPTTQAATSISLSGGGAGACDHYYHQGVAQVAAVVNVGDIEVWGGDEACGVARSPTQSVTWVGRMSGPAVLAALASATWTAPVLTGCSISAFTTTQDNFVAATGSSTYAVITMTSNECRGVILMDFTIQNALLTTLFRTRVTIPVNIIVPSQSVHNFNCAATGNTANAVDPDGVSCTTPSSTVVNSGTLDATVRLCAASALGAACTTPTINIAQSGTWTLAGGLTITDDANGWSQVLSGTVNVAQSGSWSMSNSLSGGITITDDANGWAIHQDPLSGSITVDVADDTTNDGMLTVPTSMMANSTVNQTIQFPDQFHLCGPSDPGNASACPAIQADSTVDFGDFDGLGQDAAWLLLLWLVAFIWCLRQAKLFAALAATVAVICILIPGPTWIGWVGVLFFVVALWLEAVARERLPYHWFNGTKPS